MDSINDIRNMQLRVEGNMIVTGNGDTTLSKLSFISSNKFLLVATLIPFVVIWIILVHVVSKLIYAKAVGERLQDSCKFEYMENETVRFKITRTYQQYNYLLSKVAPMLFLIPIGFIYIASVEETFRIMRHSVFSSNSLLLKVIGAIILVIYVALPLSSGLTFVILNSKASTKYNVPLKDKALQLANNLMYSSLFVAYVLAFALFMYLKISSRIILFVLGIVFTWIVSAMYLKNLHGMYNGTIVPYEQKTKEVNTLIHEKRSSGDAMLDRYFLTNIRRAHPKETIDSLGGDTKYKDKLYAYLMHRNGDETFSLSGASHVVSMRTIKEKCKHYYLMSIRTSEADFNSDIKTIEAAVTNKSNIPSLSYTPLSFHVRFYMFNLLYQNAGMKLPSIQSMNVNVSLPSQIGNLNIDSMTLRTVLKKYVPYPSAIVNVFGDNAPVKKWTASEVLSELLRGGYNSNEEAIDAFLCVLLHVSNFDDNTMIDLKKFKAKINELQDTLSNFEPASVYAIFSRVANKVDGLIETLPLRTLQRNMAELRNMNAPMIRATNQLTNLVFWASVAIIVAVSFVIFHFIYKRAKDITCIIFTGSVLIVFFVAAWYSWVMGNIK